MASSGELVSQLRASLRPGLRLKDAEAVLRSLEDEVLVPRGLYLDRGLAHSANDADVSPEIVGLVTRADGRNVSELEVSRVTDWLGRHPAIAEFSMGPLTPASEARAP
jgi:hypothetical protein